MAKTTGKAKQSEFVGKAKPLVKADYKRAAARLGCEVAAIEAVAEVESGGRSGFLKDGRPKILFESHKFHKMTGGKYDSSHPDISTAKWVRNYEGGAKEYGRLERAIALDREAALKSASWGTFQILGQNHALCGFDNVEDYVKAQLPSAGAHLDAFVGFVISNKLDDELRDKRWADFARVYNGPGYKQNRYDEKMADAYLEKAGGVLMPSAAEIQSALNRHGADLTVDGKTGPMTRAAIRAFQEREGLTVSGMPDPETLSALGLGEMPDPVALNVALNK